MAKEFGGGGLGQEWEDGPEENIQEGESCKHDIVTVTRLQFLSQNFQKKRRMKSPGYFVLTR